MLRVFIRFVRREVLSILNFQIGMSSIYNHIIKAILYIHDVCYAQRSDLFSSLPAYQMLYGSQVVSTLPYYKIDTSNKLLCTLHEENTFFLNKVIIGTSYVCTIFNVSC